VLTKEDKEDWNVAHAESGLVLMTAEGLLVATILAVDDVDLCRNLAWMFVGVFVFSYGGFVQHAIERGRFDVKKEEVTRVLKSLSMIIDTEPPPPKRWLFLLGGAFAILIAILSVSFLRSRVPIMSYQAAFVWPAVIVVGVLGVLSLCAASMAKEKGVWT
jgi:hypothetical protein